MEESNYKYNVGSKVECWYNSCWLSGVIQSELNREVDLSVERLRPIKCISFDPRYGFVVSNGDNYSNNNEPVIRTNDMDERRIVLTKSGNLPPLYQPSPKQQQQQQQQPPPQSQQSLLPVSQQSQERSAVTSAISTQPVPPLSLPQSPNVPPQYITEKYYVIDKDVDDDDDDEDDSSDYSSSSTRSTILMSSSELYSDEDMPTMSPIQSHNPPPFNNNNKNGEEEEEEEGDGFILEQYQQVQQQIHHQLKTQKKLQEYEKEPSKEPPSGMPNPLFLSSPPIQISSDNNNNNENGNYHYTVKSPSKLKTEQQQQSQSQQSMKPSQSLEPMESSSKYIKQHYDPRLLEESMMGEDSQDSDIQQQVVDEPLTFPSPEKSPKRSKAKAKNMSYYMEDTYKKHEAKEYIPLPFNNVQPIKLGEEGEGENNNNVNDYIPPTQLYKSTTTTNKPSSTASTAAELASLILPPPPLNTSTKIPHFVKEDGEKPKAVMNVVNDNIRNDQEEEYDDNNNDEDDDEEDNDDEERNGNYNNEYYENYNNNNNEDNDNYDNGGRESPMVNIPCQSILNVPAERVESAEDPRPLEFQTIDTTSNGNKINRNRPKRFVTMDVNAKKEKAKNNKISPIPIKKQSKTNDSKLTKEELEKKKAEKIEKRKQRKAEKEKKKQERQQQKLLEQQQQQQQQSMEGEREGEPIQQMVQRLSPFVLPPEQLQEKEKEKQKPKSAGFHTVMDRISPFTQMNSVINLPPSPLRTETPEDQPIVYSQLPPKVLLSEHFSNLKVLFQKKFTNSNEMNLMLFRIFVFNYQHKYKCLPDTLEEFLIDNNIQLTPSQLYFVTEYSLSKRKFNPELLIRLLPEGLSDQFVDTFKSLFKYIKKDDAPFNLNPITVIQSAITRSPIVTAAKFVDLFVKRIRSPITPPECAYLFDRMDYTKLGRMSLPFIVTTYLSFPSDIEKRKDKVRYKLFKMLFDIKDKGMFKSPEAVFEFLNIYNQKTLILNEIYSLLVMMGYYLPLEDLKFIAPQEGFSVKYFKNLFKQFQDVVPPTTVTDSPKKVSLMKGKRVSVENMRRNSNVSNNPPPFMPCSKKVNIAKAEELGDDFKPLKKKKNLKKNKKSKNDDGESESEDESNNNNNNNGQLPILCPYFISKNDEIENSFETADPYDNEKYNSFNYERNLNDIPSVSSSKSAPEDNSFIGNNNNSKMRDLSPINVQSRMTRKRQQQQQQEQRQSVSSGNNNNYYANGNGCLNDYQPQFIQQQQQIIEEESNVEEGNQQQQLQQEEKQFKSPQYVKQYQPVQQEFTPPLHQYLPKLQQQQQLDTPIPQFPPPPAPQIQLHSNNNNANTNEINGNNNINTNNITVINNPSFPPKVVINNKVSPIYNHDENSVSPKSSCFVNQYEMIDASDLPLKHQRIGNLIVSEKESGSSPLLNYYNSINPDNRYMNNNNNYSNNSNSNNGIYNGYYNKHDYEDEDIIDEEVREILNNKSKPINAVKSKPRIRPSPYAVPVLKKGEAQLLMKAYSLPYGMMPKKSARKLIIKHVSPDKMKKGYSDDKDR